MIKSKFLQKLLDFFSLGIHSQKKEMEQKYDGIKFHLNKSHLYEKEILSYMRENIFLPNGNVHPIYKALWAKYNYLDEIRPNMLNNDNWISDSEKYIEEYKKYNDHIEKEFLLVPFIRNISRTKILEILTNENN